MEITIDARQYNALLAARDTKNVFRAIYSSLHLCSLSDTVRLEATNGKQLLTVSCNVYTDEAGINICFTPTQKAPARAASVRIEVTDNFVNITCIDKNNVVVLNFACKSEPGIDYPDTMRVLDNMLNGELVAKDSVSLNYKQLNGVVSAMKADIVNFKFYNKVVEVIFPNQDNMQYISMLCIE